MKPTERPPCPPYNRCGRGSWAAALAMILGISLLSACRGPTAAQPAPLAAMSPATQPASQPAGFGFAAERCRQVSQSDEIVSVLYNGATVIVKRVPTPVVAVRGYALTGGVYEGQWLGAGLSHLLEHLVAGGSCQRRTEEQNRDLLQEIGNDSDAYTTDDHTCFYINTTPAHMEQAVDLVTGWMLGARITQAEFDRERQVVQRELEKGKGEPDRQYYYLWATNRYRVSPARVPVVGYQEVIQGVKRDEVFQYYQKAYQPNNLLFVVVGDLPPQQMLEAVQRNISLSPPGRVFDHAQPDEPPVDLPRKLVATFPNLGEARFGIGFPTVDLHNPDLYALDLLATVLGDGESSLLVEDLRDQLHLVSNVSASDQTPQYVSGTFTIDMQGDPAKMSAAISAVLDQIEKIKTDGVDPRRVRRAKAQMRADRVKGLQTAEDIAGSLGTDYLSTGDIHFTDRYLDRIAQVTPQQLQSAARRYFLSQRMMTTALVPAGSAKGADLSAAEDLLRPKPNPAAAVAGAAASAGASAVQRRVLDNGTILLLKRIPTTPLVRISLYSLGGMSIEDASNNGIGNLAMEMLQRGAGDRDGRRLAEFFDSIGADLDTACDDNTWVWAAQCMKQDLAKTMKVFGDVVCRPTFPESEMSALKDRIAQDIGSQDDDWSDQAVRFFRQSYFGPMDSPYRFESLGSRPNLARFSHQQMVDWYHQKILTGRRVLAIFGDIDLDQAAALAQSALASLPKVSATPEVPNENWGGPANAAPGIRVERVEVKKTEKDLAGVVIGFQSNSIIGDSVNPTIELATTLAAGFTYPTGYLYDTLRGRGLVYQVEAQNWPGRIRATPGTLIVLAGCDPKNVNQVVDLILQNMARLQGSDADMQVDWFHRAKEMIPTADAMENQTAAQQADTAALDELYSLGYDYHAKFVASIRDLTLEDVRRIARERIRSCVVTVCTPNPELLEIKPGVRRYDSFPPIELTPRGIQHDVGGK